MEINLFLTDCFVK